MLHYPTVISWSHLNNVRVRSCWLEAENNQDIAK